MDGAGPSVASPAGAQAAVCDPPRPDPPGAAAAAGLRYVSDESPGIRRRRAGRAFRYLGPDGRTVCDQATLERIRKLAIPPAYRDVWICPDPLGHIQATGRDARGRKQYRYHPRWREIRDENKYGRLIGFARTLSALRGRIEQDMTQPGLPRGKVLAAIVDLLDTTFIRIGNEAYARDNKSYGLTTLRDRHVEVAGSELRFEFRGKSGKTWRIRLRDRRVARIVKSCQDLPGQALFQYRGEDGERHAVGSGDINDYLREIGGEGISAKEFRTWAGTVQTARMLRDMGPAETESAAKHNLAQTLRQVAGRLGNTPTICRQCYVHPAVIAGYRDGTLLAHLEAPLPPERPAELDRLTPEEVAMLTFLERGPAPPPATDCA